MSKERDRLKSQIDEAQVEWEELNDACDALVDQRNKVFERKTELHLELTRLTILAFNEAVEKGLIEP